MTSPSRASPDARPPTPRTGRPPRRRRRGSPPRADCPCAGGTRPRSSPQDGPLEPPAPRVAASGPIHRDAAHEDELDRSGGPQRLESPGTRLARPTGVTRSRGGPKMPLSVMLWPRHEIDRVAPSHLLPAGTRRRARAGRPRRPSARVVARPPPGAGRPTARSARTLTPRSRSCRRTRPPVRPVPPSEQDACAPPSAPLRLMTLLRVLEHVVQRHAEHSAIRNAISSDGE